MKLRAKGKYLQDREKETRYTIIYWEEFDMKHVWKAYVGLYRGFKQRGF
jgi:hypothetical protein